MPYPVARYGGIPLYETPSRYMPHDDPALLAYLQRLSKRQAEIINADARERARPPWSFSFPYEARPPKQLTIEDLLRKKPEKWTGQFRCVDRGDGVVYVVDPKHMKHEPIKFTRFIGGSRVGKSRGTR